MWFIYMMGMAFADCPQDDSYEQNDDINSAVSLGGNSATGLFVCDTDEDWFIIQGTSGQLLTIDATFLHADGDIDIKLYELAAPETSIASSVSITDNESLTHMAETTGSY